MHTRKELWLALEPAHPTLVQPQSAPMAIMITTRTRALLTATTALIGSPKDSLSAPAHGSAALMDALAFMAARSSGEASMTANAATLDAVTSGAIMDAEVTRGKDSAGEMAFVGATLTTAGTAAETHEAAGVLAKVTSTAKAAFVAATPTRAVHEVGDAGKFCF